MKNNKYTKWIGDDNYTAKDWFPVSSQIDNDAPPPCNNIPKQLRLQTCVSPGFYFGCYTAEKGQYVGMPQGTEGNIAILGGCGTGKSAGIAKPTLCTWQGTMCVTDIKGELSDFYENLYQQKIVTRPFKIFDPMKDNGIGYDPFYCINQDNEFNLINKVREMASIIIPFPPDVKEPFWIESEQSILAAALLYNIRLGLSFSETMLSITHSSVNKLIQKILRGEDESTKMILGDTANLKPETLAAFDREIRNKLIVFSAAPIINAFRDAKKDPDCFTWNDLDNYNIFLRIPPEMIEQWSGVINLMYAQLIHHLEGRPDMYTTKGKHNTQTLLLMDEFARFGKLEMITNAMATLRSKNVNICLFLQSLAQLDKLYGIYNRRIILDNCQYKAILSANNAETQEYFSNLIGTHLRVQHGYSSSYNDFYDYSSHTEQFNETREYIIFPHELSTLTDILLLTPYGFCRVDKLQLHNNLSHHPLLPEPIITNATACKVISTSEQLLSQQQCNEIQQEDTCNKGTTVTNEYIHIKTVYCNDISVSRPKTKTERSQNMLPNKKTIEQSLKHIAQIEQSNRIKQRQQKKLQAKKNQRRNYIIGELVSRYFPEVLKLEPGTNEQNAVTFSSLESFLSVLASNQELIKQIKRDTTNNK